MDVADFARSEVLHDPLDQYMREVERGERNRSAVYEVAIATGKRYRAGDRIAYYITGIDPGVRIAEACKSADDWDPHFPDENSGLLSPASGRDFRPVRRRSSGRGFLRGSSAIDDLFPFSADGIIIQTQTVGEEGAAAGRPRTHAGHLAG